MTHRDGLTFKNHTEMNTNNITDIMNLSREFLREETEFECTA